LGLNFERKKMTRRIQQLFDLTGQTALITGGSRGLGLQMAHALGEAGARLMLSSRKADDLEVAVAELKAAGIDADYIAADCGKEEDIRRLANETMKRMGRIDILINNAGATWGAPAEDHPVSAWDKVMNLNIRGYFILSQEVAKLSMIPNRKGRVLNIASVAGLAGNPIEMQTIAYNTSKGAVINFTKALAGEWGQYGITVNAIAPGAVVSEAEDRVFGDRLSEYNSFILKNQSVKTRILAEDVANLAVFLASDAARMISGQNIGIDGGW
jgi:gluconate 5-dehydrogenase